MTLRERLQLRRLARMYAADYIAECKECGTPISIENKQQAAEVVRDRMKDDLGALYTEIDWGEVLKMIIEILTILLMFF